MVQLYDLLIAILVSKRNKNKEILNSSKRFICVKYLMMYKGEMVSKILRFMVKKFQLEFKT